MTYVDEIINDGVITTTTSSTNATISIVTLIYAILYVLSGCSQPLLMTIATNYGLADPKAQIYMLFYYFGPALVIFTMCFDGYDCCSSYNNKRRNKRQLSIQSILKCCGIAIFDIISTSMNYTGASLAGPTLFSIIYSSVTIWCAVFSYALLKRQMSKQQWYSVVIVFIGLCITATDSLQFGNSVIFGVILVVVGSMMHALTYILCEAIMTIGNDKLTVYETCGIQSTTSFIVFLFWQLIYTLPRNEELLTEPMSLVGTTTSMAIQILVLFAIANLIHSVAYYETLVRYKGGATSAGVFKGLQAALVFVVTHLVFCGRTGGNEMCFSLTKLISLITVIIGVCWYGIATHQHDNHDENNHRGRNTNTTRSSSNNNNNNRHEYEEIIGDDDDVDYDALSMVVVEIEPLPSSLHSS